MKRFLIGHSPLTTIAGYILSILIVVEQLQQKGIDDWRHWIVPIAIAIFGRIVGDDHPSDNNDAGNNNRSIFTDANFPSNN